MNSESKCRIEPRQDPVSPTTSHRIRIKQHQRLLYAEVRRVRVWSSFREKFGTGMLQQLAP